MMNRYLIKQIGVDDQFIAYTSPSTILGQLSKGDNLIQWAANLAVQHNDPLAWKTKRDSTADIGSALHGLVETYIKLDIDVKGDIGYFLDATRKLDYNLRQMFYQFWVWQNKNVKRFLESEQPIVHKQLCFAGTLDFIYEGFDGKIYCVDLKTSNAIYKDHEIQVVAYKYARETMDGKYKIQFNQDGNHWEKIFNYNLIKIQNCAILNISRDYFDLKFKIVREEEYKMQSFAALLRYFYVSAARRMNNYRAKERR